MSRYFTTLHTVRDLPACYVCTSTVGQEVEEVMYTVHVHEYFFTTALALGSAQICRQFFGQNIDNFHE